MKPEPNVCTKQCHAKQSYHFTVAVTISSVEDLDSPRKNATAKKNVARRKVGWTRYQNACVKGCILGTEHCVRLCCAKPWRGRRADTVRRATSSDDEKQSLAGYRRKLPNVIKIAPSSSESALKPVFRQKRSVFKTLQHPVMATTKTADCTLF